MSLESKNIIQNAILDMRQLNANDVLVDASHTSILAVNLEIESQNCVLDLDDKIQSILKKTSDFQRETGTNALCLTSGIIEWELKGKKVKTPILLIPLLSNISKLKKSVEITLQTEEAFINPFLLHHLKNEFDLTPPDFEIGLETPIELKNWLNSTQLQFSFSEQQFLGNFHHHRYQIVKELEGLLGVDSLGKNVEQILGKEDVIDLEEVKLVKDVLFPTDVDQLHVFESIATNNTVIQGPPGTGKSQVLSNLVGKIMMSDAKGLIVSEKRVALEVIQKKMAEFKLDDFTFITTSETVSGDFISSLKNVWNRLETDQHSSRKINLRLSEQHLQNLQFQLNLLTQKELIGGVSFDEFKQLSQTIDFSKTIFKSETPTVSEWLKDKSAIEEIYRNDLQNSLEFIPFEVLKSNSFLSFDNKISEWSNWLKELALFEIKTPKDLENSMKLAAICQVIENESSKPYFAILNPTSKERKKYTSLKKKLHLIEKKRQSFESEKANWETEPSENESIQLLKAVDSTSYFQKRKAKKRISQLAISSFVDPVLALSKWLEYIEIEKEFSKILFNFSEIGVQYPISECLQIDLFIQQVNSAEWEKVSTIEPTKRKLFCEFHFKLKQLNEVIKTYFQIESNALIEPVFETVLSQFETLIRSRNSILKIEKSSYRLSGNCATFQEFEECVFKSNWVKFESNFPELARFKTEDIHTKIAQIIACQEEESQLFSEQIVEKIQSNFQHFNQLLRTPAHKLSAEEKEKKQLLRKGKAILVKEFSKSKSHPSIRELLLSEASSWIHLLKPIWLSNPVQLARCFPLEKDFFNFVIFDEASQIPLTRALGALHRGKRIIVAGDEHQMSPTTYFKSTNYESVDLLHQAGFYWKNRSLKHHYRSVHPALIEFSNRHFYSNSLIAYPSANSVDNPIQLHRCENGIFENRVNEEEAKMVVGLIERKLQLSDSFGVVAFSESQLDCIWKKLNPTTQSHISEKIETGNVFFKSLENVQGEESDQLIISLGYAKNREGDFQLRFGPINQKNGSKRLNVLLTRAKKSIDFVTSVSSHDFKISDNESVNLLRLFLIQLENSSTHPLSKLHFPFGLIPEITPSSNGNIIHFPAIYSRLSDANELVTFQRVLENRGWEIK